MFVKSCLTVLRKSSFEKTGSSSQLLDVTVLLDVDVLLISMTSAGTHRQKERSSALEGTSQGLSRC